MKPRRVLVVGYGSTIRSDDGAGRAVAERIAARPGTFDVIASHQLDFDMAEAVHQHDAVLFVDASREGKPGQLRCRHVRPDRAGEVMTHHLTPETLLALVRQLWGRAPDAWTLSVTGSDFGLGESLSPEVSSRMPLLRAIVESAAERLARTPGAAGGC